MSKFLDRFTESLWKKQKLSEEEMLHAFLERVSLTNEEATAARNATDEERRREEGFRIYIRRMKTVMKDALITDEDIIKSYPEPLKAILLMRFLEKQGEKRSVRLAEKINEAGLKFVQNDVWILPPSKTPQDLVTDQDLKQWVYENLTKTLYKKVQFVFPFIAIIDMRKVIAPRRGILRKYTGNTVFNVMELDEMVPPSYVYYYLKERSLGIEDVVRRGDLLFLASALNDQLAVADIKEKRRQIVQRLFESLNKGSLSLEDISNIAEGALTKILEGLVQHPDGVAQRLIIESKYWERFLNSQVS
ncbi:MAG: hypothetical protein HYW93_04740 [Thaumarchaeota archaeon]|nr:hypothetical protein [Nitrososphaerota archaeon]